VYHHRQGVLERRLDLVPHRALGGQRVAEAAVGEVLDVQLVLRPLALVEAELLDLRLLELLRARAAAERRDGVAGQGAEEEEVQRDRETDRDERERDALYK